MRPHAGTPPPLHAYAYELMRPTIIEGDLLDQDVEVIVNAWNRNVLPWWLLVPAGVSGAIKRRGGLDPFRELARHGLIPLGGAVLTKAGKLPFKGIIHVAGISLLWVASERSIRGSVRSALAIVEEHGFKSVAFPIVGGGTGGVAESKALDMIVDEIVAVGPTAHVRVVKFVAR